MTSTGDRQIGAAIVLAGLPGMGPRRLAALLDAWEPADALARIASGRADRLELPDGAPLLADAPGEGADTLRRTWASAASGAEPSAAHVEHAKRGVAVLLRTDPGYPAALADDVEPPAVLFVLGSLDHLDAPRAGIVGTRRCTGAGAGLARELGRELTTAGVAVVSGLALGIDGAAHRGALDVALDRSHCAAPVGVVGCGLDVVYPERHRDLWEAVAASGVLLSETPLGVRPAAWRFPARNRIIAGLADVLVVVESHAVGGSLHTVTEAERRDVPVLAVPGSVRSPAAAGTNQLLAEGCHPARDVADVLVALGLTPAARRPSRDRRPPPDEAEATVLEAFAWEPATLEQLAVRTGAALGSVAVTLEGLVAKGWVWVHGGWYERVAPR